MNLPIPDKQAYLSAKPFPHLVIDGVFHPFQLTLQVLRAWPQRKDIDYRQTALRTGTTDEKVFGPHIASFVKTEFHSQKFIFFLEELTGIGGLVLDCREIGLHETFPGGSLDAHVDYNINEKSRLQHRVNAILYLNENWKDEYKGHLELLGDAGPIGMYTAKEIAPIFNRLVVFNIDNAWHGHPEPLKCPEGMSRRSIALNYFSAPVNGVTYIPTTYRTGKSWKDISPRKIFGFINKLVK